MFALPISMPRFKNINFYQNIPKVKLFLQKNAKFFLVLVASPPDPRASNGSWGFRTQAFKTSPHCEFLATRLVVLLLLCYFVLTDFAAR